MKTDLNFTKLIYIISIMEQGKKAIEINKEVNDVLERYFEGEISSITTSKLDKHYKADEIDTKMFKFFNYRGFPRSEFCFCI